MTNHPHRSAHSPWRPPRAEEVVALRTELGLSQRAAAGLIGRTERQWQKYEAGELDMPALAWHCFRYWARGVAAPPITS